MGLNMQLSALKVYSVKRRLLISAFSMNKSLVTRNKAQVLRYVVLFSFLSMPKEEKSCKSVTLFVKRRLLRLIRKPIIEQSVYF